MTKEQITIRVRAYEFEPPGHIVPERIIADLTYTYAPGIEMLHIIPGVGTLSLTVQDAPEYFRKCDGNHAEPACRDAQCWHRSPPVPAEPAKLGMYQCLSPKCEWRYMHIQVQDDIGNVHSMWSRAIIESGDLPDALPLMYLTWENFCSEYGDCAHRLRKL